MCLDKAGLVRISCNCFAVLCVHFVVVVVVVVVGGGGEEREGGEVGRKEIFSHLRD